MPTTQLSKNVFLQAKRASYLLNISLSQSKHFIAKAFYRCHDYQDLQNKIKCYGINSQVYPFAKVNSSANTELIEYVEKNLVFLVSRLQQYFYPSTNQAIMSNIIWKIFGINRKISRNCLIENTNHIEWSTFSGKSIKNEPVIFCNLLINDCPFIVLATKVVTVDSFPIFNELEKKFLHDRVFHTECIPFIQWRDINEWKNIFVQFFKDYSHCKTFDKNLLQTVLTPNSDGEVWFFQIFRRFFNVLNEEFGINPIRHIQIAGSYYSIIGLPLAPNVLSESSFKKSSTEIYISDDDINNDKCIIELGSNILCIDLFELNDECDYVGESVDYFEGLNKACSPLDWDEKGYLIVNNKRYKAYLRTATESEYLHYFQPGPLLEMYS